MKKLICILMVLGLLLALSGCRAGRLPDVLEESPLAQPSKGDWNAAQIPGETQGDAGIPNDPTGTEPEIPSISPTQNTEGPPVNSDYTDGPPLSSHTHVFFEEVIEPTCLEKGYTVVTCVCGYWDVQDITLPGYHSYGEWEILREPTESQKGKAQVVCRNCGLVETRQLPVAVPGHTHDYVEAPYSEPACGDHIAMAYTCDCGDFYILDGFPPVEPHYKYRIQDMQYENGGRVHQYMCRCGYYWWGEEVVCEDVEYYSYSDVESQYRPGDPGVQTDGFVNKDFDQENKRFCITETVEEAIQRAKNEVTIPYDATKVSLDLGTGIWKVEFFTEGVPGGSQTVYVSCNGSTLRIIYGE